VGILCVLYYRMDAVNLVGIYRHTVKIAIYTYIQCSFSWDCCLMTSRPRSEWPAPAAIGWGV
jgi:hypothetical protein